MAESITTTKSNRTPVKPATSSDAEQSPDQSIAPERRLEELRASIRANSEKRAELQAAAEVEKARLEAIVAKCASRVGLLTVDDLALLLACSTRSCYRLIDSGRAPRPLKLAGMRRLSAADVADWIANRYADCRPPELRPGRHAKAATKNPAGPVEARRG